MAAQFHSVKTHRDSRRYPPHCLALCWVVGMVCGFGLFWYGQCSVGALMRGIFLCPVSIVPLLTVCVIPFLVTAYAVFLSEPWILFAACFGKAVLFSFVFSGIGLSYGSAGWLMRMLLFGDSVCVILLYVLWSRSLSGRKTSRWMFLTFLGLSLGAYWMDCYIIAPFLASLIDF